MAMELNSDDFIIGAWFAAREDGDWLMVCKKNHGEGDWVGQYRFRYYKGDQVFDSEDQKSFYKFQIPGDKPADVVESELTRFMNEAIKTQYPKTSYVKVHGDVQKYMYRCAQEPWFHMKYERIEDVERSSGELRARPSEVQRGKDSAGK